MFLDKLEYDSEDFEDMDLSERSSYMSRKNKEFKNQRLKKKIVKKGDASDAPRNGDVIQVHYTGTLLDGTKFDSSRNSREPFTFTLGQGQVIKGLDEGIKTMNKGENAIFTIPPRLAYGESGSPPAIPPNATLQFDVELLSWSKDIYKDGGIFKKILKDREKWAIPKDPDEVLVKYEARLEDGTVISKSDGVEFTVLEDHFCPGLSKAIKTMKKGEKVLVKPQYGFGEKGKPASSDEEVVPPNATLNIVSWKRVSKVTDDKKVVKKILRAGKGYEGSNDIIPISPVKFVGMPQQNGTIFDRKDHGDDESDLFEFKTDEVIEGLDWVVRTMSKGEVLELESTNVKALYRRSQAYMKMANFELAEFDIKKALEIDPDNRMLSSTLQNSIVITDIFHFCCENREVTLGFKTLKERIKEYNKDAKFYGNMFAKLNKFDSYPLSTICLV
ncbi:hypothetical protein BUALT_Bualt13G0114900 [Buddleja alternifolia]|uniref:peptidylprolyl isomerase n=1 Tax=Buddleja alternifolia TaxID=168488 RepID=A0AAV6WNN9_9LAMI|nr:hypothetical protein BUALT_Bualt13G0114900 [Buddleja alternifolia]